MLFTSKHYKHNTQQQQNNTQLYWHWRKLNEIRVDKKKRRETAFANTLFVKAFN